mmetsp:Transcript_11889/g.26167  ORF Transcript_11889/g.26167 Transcript_11889/m.26167 type:complete len:221 (+) Transcript_11889:99-761(+)
MASARPALKQDRPTTGGSAPVLLDDGALLFGQVRRLDWMPTPRLACINSAGGVAPMAPTSTCQLVASSQSSGRSLVDSIPLPFGVGPSSKGCSSASDLRSSSSGGKEARSASCSSFSSSLHCSVTHLKSSVPNRFTPPEFQWETTKSRFSRPILSSSPKIFSPAPGSSSSSLQTCTCPSKGERIRHAWGQLRADDKCGLFCRDSMIFGTCSGSITQHTCA